MIFACCFLCCLLYRFFNYLLSNKLCKDCRYCSLHRFCNSLCNFCVILGVCISRHEIVKACDEACWLINLDFILKLSDPVSYMPGLTDWSLNWECLSHSWSRLVWKWRLIQLLPQCYFLKRWIKLELSLSSHPAIIRLLRENLTLRIFCIPNYYFLLISFVSFITCSVYNILTFTKLRSLGLSICFWVLQGTNQFHWCMYQTRLVDKVPLVKVMFDFHILLVYLVKCLYIFLKIFPIENAT